MRKPADTRGLIIGCLSPFILIFGVFVAAALSHQSPILFLAFMLYLAYCVAKVIAS